MSITLYHIETKSIIASITQDKYTSCFSLVIYDHNMQVIKKSCYLSFKAAKQAIKRYLQKEGA
jgi:hypothetical protein